MLRLWIVALPRPLPRPRASAGHRTRPEPAVGSPTAVDWAGTGGRVAVGVLGRGSEAVAVGAAVGGVGAVAGSRP